MASLARRRSPDARAQRHRLVDTAGLVLKVVVHPARLPNLHDLQDRLGAKLVLGALGTAFPRLRQVWADQGDTGALGSGAESSWAFTGRSPLPGDISGVSSTAMRQRCWRRWVTNLASMFCLAVGWGNAPSPGSGARAD